MKTKMTCSELIGKLIDDGVVTEPSQEFDEQKARMRDQSEIGRLYVEQSNFIKNYREG